MSSTSQTQQIPITALKGVGKQLANKFKKLSIENIEDLLFHLPFRYQDRTKVTPIGSLHREQEVVIEAEVMASDIVFGKKRSLMCRVSDGTGTLTLRFFHFSAAQKNQFSRGQRIRCYGEARKGKAGLELYHPEYQIITDSTPPLTQQLTPLYPLTDGISQLRLRQLTDQALVLLSDSQVRELLPDGLKQDQSTLKEALLYVHRPPKGVNLYELVEGQHPYVQRLVFEEFIAHHLSLLRLRQQIKKSGAPPLKSTNTLTKAFLEQLPFALTGAQSRVVNEISEDMSQAQPCLRLVQGDVGSGKTIVAALAALQCVENKFQAALMAPTEILAEQHYKNFTDWCKPLGVHVTWLAGKMTAKQKRLSLEEIASGAADIVIGTHAIFQETVIFKSLALVIIDEQHRFGVHQRLALKEKAKQHGAIPHQVIMTATPIPRTLAMSAYGDLDNSVIDELPPGRTPVQTVVISQTRRDDIIARVKRAAADGKQVYWVCTLIEESEDLQCQAAEVAAEDLRKAIPDFNIGLVHGRQKPAEKESTMQAFKAGELQILVATTVIEVGVDVPNASLMIIENPERLGLSQLHQLRGRVGRGSIESFCVLLYQTPLSLAGKQRLAIMRDTNDGFKIAEADLKLRGPGEVMGTRQTGAIQFRIGDLERDEQLLHESHAVAHKLLQQLPAEQTDMLIARWLNEGDKFAQV